MATKSASIPTTSPFATATTNAADVKRLIAAGLDHVGADGEIDWANFPVEARPFNVEGGSCPIGYSRAWLIVRRAWLEVNQPKALVTLPALTGDKVKDDTAWSKIVSPMRTTELLSWGEIAVRCGKPESAVRRTFRATEAKKDLGLRIGKGGRFAYDEPEFYLEHRRVEGAEIPVDVKAKPAVEQLLNAKNAKGEVVRFQRQAEGGAKKVG